MHQIVCRLGLCPRPTGGTYIAPPDPLAGLGVGPTVEVCGSTRTRGYGSGRVDISRVGSGMGSTSTGTGIPGFTRKEHDYFHDFGARTFFISACFLNYL